MQTGNIYIKSPFFSMIPALKWEIQLPSGLSSPGDVLSSPPGSVPAGIKGEWQIGSVAIQFTIIVMVNVVENKLTVIDLSYLDHLLFPFLSLQRSN